MSEELNHLMPKNKVIYRMPCCDGFYGFTDKGTKVSNIIYGLCCEEIVEKNYEEYGVEYPYSKFWDDVKDFSPEVFSGFGDYKSISQLMDTHYAELIAARDRYLYEVIGFKSESEAQPDPEYFNIHVTGVENLKSEILQAIRKGVKLYDAHEYIKYLRKNDYISDTDFDEVTDWLDDKFGYVFQDRFDKYRDKLMEVKDSEEDDEEDEEDIMSSTNITANTSAGKPKNLVIYKKLNDDCYGFTDRGRKVTDTYYDSCCRSVIIQNYMESGMNYNQAYFQFWLDVRDFSPKEFDEICEDYGGVDITDLEHDSNFDDALQGDELYELAYKYVDDLGFHSELDPEMFPVDVSTPEEVKSIVKKAMLAGADDYVLTEYLERLHYVHRKFDWGEYQALRTWVNQKFNAGKVGKKVYDILTDNPFEEDEEDDIMSSTHITASYDFNYDLSGEDDVKAEIKKALQHARYYDDLGNSCFHGTELQDIYKYLDELCYDREQLTLDEYDNIISYIRRFHRNWYQTKYNQYADEEDSIEEDDILGSTKITASTNSVGTPNEPVLYEKAGQQGFYGYSNGGKKVTGPSFDRCAMNIVLQNYMESGMSDDDARYQFWQDVKDFNPEAMIERCGGDLDVRSEEFEYIRSEGLLNELRFEYLVNGLDFYDVLDQNIFDYKVTNIDEVKPLLKKAMLAGATPNQYYDYFGYLLNSSIITQDEYDELHDFIDKKFEDSGFRTKNYARVYENSGDEDEDDIMNSTKIKENNVMNFKRITASKSCKVTRIPNHLGYYGYSDSGIKVTGDTFDTCCMNLVIQDYIDAGMNPNDAYMQFWYDIRDTYPDEFDVIGDVKDIDTLLMSEHYVELNQLRFQYLTSDLGFEETAGTELLSFDVSNVDEAKSEIKNAIFHSADRFEVSNYICDLHNKRILSERECKSLQRWADNLYNKFFGKLSEIDRDYIEDEEDDIMSATKATKPTKRKFTKKPRYFANMVSANNKHIWRK